MRKLPVFILVLFIGVALMAGLIAPFDPWQRFAPFLDPDGNHILGTNDMGNDIFSELLYGSKVSLLTGLATATIATGLGIILGMTAGYFRGAADEFIMGLTDITLMIPRLPILIIFAAFMRPGYWTIILVLGLLWWPSTARVIRSKTMQIRESDFIVVNTCLGISIPRILFTDIFPNILWVAAPKFLLTIASAMVSEASLSFLGLGDPSVKSWGMMLNYAFHRGGFWNSMWWWYLPPGLCLITVVMAARGIENFLHRQQTFLPEELPWREHARS